MRASVPLRSLALTPICGCTTSDPAISQATSPPSSRIFIKVKIIASKRAKQSLGLAYIWFANEQDALMAVKEMDGKFFDGRFIAVTIAEAESPSKQVRARLYKF